MQQILLSYSFLETCKTFDVLPGRLKITNVPFISFVTDDIKISWHNITTSTEKDPLETLILGIEDKRIWLKNYFVSFVKFPLGTIVSVFLIIYKL